MEPGEYESIRLKNLEDNKRVLAAFGLMNPFKPVHCVVQRRTKPTPKPTLSRKRPLPQEDLLLTGSLYGTRRKSARLSGQEAAAGLDLGSTYEELDEAEKQVTRTPVDRPNFYGPIPGVDVGMEWATRMECSRDGIHRPTVAGIHGGPDGAYSIALSGGYEDDVDLGDCFTYTGEGGRDLKGTKANPKNLRTAPQSKDQSLTRGNLALSRSVDTGNPVRVIRGYKLHSQFAPEEGYRYDGVYTVEKCWFTTGLSGFGVWKFALKRCPYQAASPWQLLQDCSSPSKPSASPSTVQGDDHKPKMSPPSFADEKQEIIKTKTSKESNGDILADDVKSTGPAKLMTDSEKTNTSEDNLKSTEAAKFTTDNENSSPSTGSSDKQEMAQDEKLTTTENEVTSTPTDAVNSSKQESCVGNSEKGGKVDEESVLTSSPVLSHSATQVKDQSPKAEAELKPVAPADPSENPTKEEELSLAELSTNAEVESPEEPQKPVHDDNNNSAKVED